MKKKIEKPKVTTKPGAEAKSGVKGPEIKSAAEMRAEALRKKTERIRMFEELAKAKGVTLEELIAAGLKEYMDRAAIEDSRQNAKKK